MPAASKTTSTSRLGWSETPSMSCPIRRRTGRSVESRASSATSTWRAVLVVMVSIKKLDDFHRLPKPGFLLSLAVGRTTGFERCGDADDEAIVLREQVKVFLGVAKHEIETGVDGEREIGIFDTRANLL